jgi:hypothetical protein
LNPGVLGKDKAVQLLSKVLNHVVSLRFTMNQDVKANLLLESNNHLNLFLDEIFVLLRSKLSLA